MAKKIILFFFICILSMSAFGQTAKKTSRDDQNYSFGLKVYESTTYPDSLRRNQEAYKWLKKAADNGDDRAMNILGKMCSEGGLHSWDKEFNDPASKKQRKEDGKKAVDWWKKAAALGNVEAEENLAQYYNVERNRPEMFKWHLSAAKHGNAGAMDAVASMYSEGDGTKTDEAESFKWRQKAVDAGATYDLYDLGLCYEKGRGVQQDYAKAMRWYREASNHGFLGEQAAYRLGLIYEEGKGVQRNYEEAVKWYKKSDWIGGAKLGFMYANGQNVKQDFREAVKWYETAAYIRPENRVLIADIYKNQLHNDEFAYRWYLAASKNSYHDPAGFVGIYSKDVKDAYKKSLASVDSKESRKTAKMKLEILKGKLTPMQIKKAEEWREQWESDMFNKYYRP